MALKIIEGEEAKKLEKEWEEAQIKRRKEAKPLIDYLINNCSIQRIGFDNTQTEEVILLKELINKTSKYYNQFDNDAPWEEIEFPHIEDINHNCGIIQITDNAGEISKLLNTNSKIKNLIEATDMYVNAYENGILHPYSTPWYWQKIIHYNFDLTKLNHSFKDDISFLKKDLPSFERAFTLTTFMNYLDTLGYPNGHDNWDNQDFFKSNYLLENDLNYLIGNPMQLLRCLNPNRYNLKANLKEGYIFEQKTKLEQVIKTLIAQ